MEGVFTYATILLEASHVPATLATILRQMQDHVWVSEHKFLNEIEGMLEHLEKFHLLDQHCST